LSWALNDLEGMPSNDPRGCGPVFLTLGVTLPCQTEDRGQVLRFGGHKNIVRGQKDCLIAQQNFPVHGPGQTPVYMRVVASETMFRTRNSTKLICLLSILLKTDLCWILIRVTTLWKRPTWLEATMNNDLNESTFGNYETTSFRVWFNVDTKYAEAGFLLVKNREQYERNNDDDAFLKKRQLVKYAWLRKKTCVENSMKSNAGTFLMQLTTHEPTSRSW